MSIYPIRTAILQNLNATECATLMSIVGSDGGLALTKAERKHFLDPRRDLAPIFEMRAALTHIGYELMVIGRDVNNLFRRIDNPLDYWKTCGKDNMLTLWLVVQRGCHPTEDKEALVGWEMTKVRPEIMWLTFVAGGIGITLKRERIRLIMKMPGYEFPRRSPTAGTDYDCHARNGWISDEDFLALQKACMDPKVPASVIGSTRFTIRPTNSLYSKLFLKRDSAKRFATYALDMSERQSRPKKLNSNGVTHMGIEGDYIWFKSTQVVFNVGDHVALDLCSTMLMDEDEGSCFTKPLEEYGV